MLQNHTFPLAVASTHFILSQQAIKDQDKTKRQRSQDFKIHRFRKRYCVFVLLYYAMPLISVIDCHCFLFHAIFIKFEGIELLREGIGVYSVL